MKLAMIFGTEVPCPENNNLNFLEQKTELTLMMTTRKSIIHPFPEF